MKKSQLKQIIREILEDEHPIERDEHGRTGMFKDLWRIKNKEWAQEEDQIIKDYLLDVGHEELISIMLHAAEFNPSLTLLDFLKPFGKKLK